MDLTNAITSNGLPLEGKHNALVSSSGVLGSSQGGVATQTNERKRAFHNGVQTGDDESTIVDNNDSAVWDDTDEEDADEEDADKEDADEEGADLFQRIDSRSNLPLHCSLITTQLRQSEGAHPEAVFTNTTPIPTLQHSRVPSPNDASLVASPKSEDFKSSSKLPHSSITSPKSARQNILKTELIGGLREHLLWERKHKTGGYVVPKRSQTAPNVANLMRGDDDGKSMRNYEPNDYNCRGW